MNNELFKQIRPEDKDYPEIIDIGCGTAIFSLVYLAKSTFIRAKLHLVDINIPIIGNAIYNYRQSSLWQKVEIIPIV